MQIHAYTHIYTYTHRCTTYRECVADVYVGVKTHLCNIHTCPCTGTQNTCKVHVTLNAKKCIYIYTYTHMHTHTYAHENTYACMTQSTRWSTDTKTDNLCTNMHTHTHTHVYERIDVQMHTHMHVGVSRAKMANVLKMFARESIRWANGSTAVLSYPDQRTPSVHDVIDVY